MRDHLEQPVGDDRRALPLELELLDGIGGHRIARETVRLLSDQDLSRGSRCLQPLRDVDRIPRHEGLGVSRIACDHLTGVYARPHRNLEPECTLELLVEARDGVPQLDGGSYRSHRVVLVERRNAKDRHHGVADELLDGAAVTLEDCARLLEVPGHDAAHPLRILVLADAGRVDDIAEQHRDRLSRLRGQGRRYRLERVSAHVAKARVRGVLGAAARTGRHGRTVRDGKGEGRGRVNPAGEWNA